jgi:limonene-1,2-epoxide hydrolase
MGTLMVNEPEEIVRAYLRGWEQWSEGVVSDLLDCLTEDAVWHNMPIEPAVGKDAIEALLRRLGPTWGSVEIEIKNLVADGSIVFVEREDKHRLADGQRIVMPVCAVFETRDGRISACRDYFDLRTWQQQSGV